MKANRFNKLSNSSYLLLTFITLFSLMFGVGAAPFLSSAGKATSISLTDIAAEISTDVGVVTTVVETETQPAIFVFEERHDSVLGQIEIASMLNRLYADYDLRHIGLEGHMAAEGPLDLSWAHVEPYYQPDQTITSREDVLVQMHQEGEFSSAELIGLVYHDVVVDGIDDADLYAFVPPEEAWNAPDFYLYLIALAGMSETNLTAWQALYDAEQYEAAFEFAVSNDAFAAEMWETLSDPVDIVSAEAWLTALDEIQAQAEAVEVDLTEDDVANLEAMGEYFEHVSQRSDALVAAVLELANTYPEAPLAMNIGALHTERVVELLTEAGVSFAVVRPLSLAEGDTAGLLSAEAYQRKQQGLSVAPDGWLGSYLDGRRKPGPTAEQPRNEIEVMFRQLAQKIAGYASNTLFKATEDEKDPDKLKTKIQEYVDGELTSDPNYKIFSEAIEITVENVTVPENGGGAIVEFSITPKIDVGFPIPDLLIRAQAIYPGKPQVTFEQRLDTAREEAQSGSGIPDEGGTGEDGTETRPLQNFCSTTVGTTTKIAETGG